MKNVDALIIGGGIASQVLAARLSANDSLKSLIMIKSDHHHNASVNNQSWLQSGALYNLDREEEYEVARLCLLFGKRLLKLRGTSFEHQSSTGIGIGVMALKNESEALKRIEFFKKVGNISYPQPMLTSAEVRHYLGEFSDSQNFTKDCRFIWTPDQPFAEGDLMRYCENLINYYGKGTIISGDAELLPSLGTTNGYYVRVNGEDFNAKQVFILAGLNTKSLLSPLGVQDKINIAARRCVLLKMDLKTNLKVDIFMDKVNNTNINIVKNRQGDKVYLLGDGLYSNVDDIFKVADLPKEPTEAEIDHFVTNYCAKNSYPHLKQRIESLDVHKQKFNVCYKVEKDHSYMPWIFDIEKESAGQYRNMFVAGSGKATLAFYLAEKLIFDAEIDDTRYSDEELAELQQKSLITHWSEN